MTISSIGMFRHVQQHLHSSDVLLREDKNKLSCIPHKRAGHRHILKGPNKCKALPPSIASDEQFLTWEAFVEQCGPSSSSGMQSLAAWEAAGCPKVELLSSDHRTTFNLINT